MQLIDFGASFMVKSATYLEVNIQPEDREWFTELVQRGTTRLWMRRQLQKNSRI